MTAYEVYLLLGSLFGALATISITSMLLNEGSARGTVITIALAAGLLFMAKQSTDGIMSINDIPPAINKAIGIFLD